MGAHQRFLLAQHLALLDALDAQIAAVGAAIAERLAPFEAELAILDSIPGVGRWTAEGRLAEIGTDMGRFPTPGHLAGWAGMCPGSDESGGKRRSGKTRTGSPALRVALTEAAYAAGRTKDTWLGARSRHLIARRGKKKTAIAVGRMILALAHLLLSTGQLYDDRLARRRAERPTPTEEDRLIHRVEQLGHRVMLEPAA